MPECRICGNEIRDGESVVEIGKSYVHHDCADAPEGSAGRTIETWSELGATNQLAMGDVQRNNQD